MRLQHPNFVRFIRDDGAVVVDSIRDCGPAKVLSFDNFIKFVPAARPVFGLPEITRLGMEGQALRIAMAIGPNAL